MNVGELTGYILKNHSTPAGKAWDAPYAARDFWQALKHLRSVTGELEVCQLTAPNPLSARRVPYGSEGLYVTADRTDDPNAIPLTDTQSQNLFNRALTHRYSIQVPTRDVLIDEVKALPDGHPLRKLL